jgi:hypothetical protein
MINKVPTLEQFSWQMPVKSSATDIPTGPNKGDRYLIPPGATGVWATHTLDIATFTGSIWEYKPRVEGLIVWVEDTDKLFVYTGSVWTEVPKAIDNNFYFGDSLLNDKTIVAKTNQTYCPTIRYNADLLKWQISNGGSSEVWTDLGSAPNRATFTNASLSAGKLTITHNKGLSAPYCIIVAIFDNNNKQIIPDEITGATNSVEVNLTSFGTLSGTWGYIYQV